jgi:hypothetical protein
VAIVDASTAVNHYYRRVAKIGFIALGIASTLILGNSLGRNGNTWAYFTGSIILTPLGVAVIAWMFETTPFRQTFNWKVASWMYLFGDIALAVCGTSLTFAMREAHFGLQWYTSKWMLAGCYLIGLVAGLGFRYKLDKPNWVAQNTLSRHNSPSKFYHDLCIYPALVAVNVFMFQAIVGHTQWYSNGWLWISLVSAALWLALSRHDAKGLETWQLHGAFDWNLVQPIAPAGMKLLGERTILEAKAWSEIHS